MSNIIPVPTTRVGDLFVRQQLIQQVQSNQLDLLRLQNQVSSGLRMELPSDDAPAALRAANLQRLLQRKAQLQSNLQGSRSFLSAAESSLSLVSAQLSDLRGEALTVADTVSTDEQRQAVIQQLDGVLQFLIDTGNATNQGRYLFAGSNAGAAPYTYDGQSVKYGGNEGSLRNYVDLETLFEMNVSGAQVLGGLSAAAGDGADLNPHLTPDTLLSTINGGQGIGPNAAVEIAITSGGTTTTEVVDLSRAATIGDVARLIEVSSPGGAQLTAEVTGNGLSIQTDTGTIRISEVGQGRTASELGILTDPDAVASDTVTGSDLNPAVLKTTPLSNLLGTKAQARLVSSGTNNDLLVTAGENGATLNGVTVQFVAGGTAGSEVVTYDEGGGTLTIQIQEGVSTAAQVAAAVTAEGTFAAAVDYRDATSTTKAGSAPVTLTATAVTAGGSGEVLDQDSGLILSNGSQSATIDISEAETVEDLLNLINGAGLGFLAEVNSSGTGITVRSRLSGADFTIGENGGTTATQLGFRTLTTTTNLADFNRGLGISTVDGGDFEIEASDGTILEIDVSSAATVEDVLNLINTHADNAGLVTARLATTGNGFELVDELGGELVVRTVNNSAAAEHLGLVSTGATEASSTSSVLTGQDQHPLETDSVFNTLLRLRDALEEGNAAEIGRAIERLDEDSSRVNFARAELGSRLQSLDVLETRLQDENVQLQSALSDEVDVDLVDAISQLTARQYALQASLSTAANLLQLSILDFI